MAWPHRYSQRNWKGGQNVTNEGRLVIKPNPHMESQNVQRQLVCESCGATFGCCPVPNSGCWCADVPISDAALAELKTKFGECICPACLAKYAQKEPAAQG